MTPKFASLPRRSSAIFSRSAAVATPAENRKKPPPVSAEMVAILTEHVHRIEAIEGVLSDWSLPGEHPAASAFDVARTVCRRAERDLVRLIGSGEHVDPAVLVLGGAMQPRYDGAVQSGRLTYECALKASKRQHSF